MNNLINIIREQVRLIVDPLIIKFRQEIYGPGVTNGRYISETKIPPEIPRNNDNVNGLTGEGIKGRVAIWTEAKELSASNSLLEKIAPTASGGGVYVTSGHFYVGKPSVSGEYLDPMNIYGDYVGANSISAADYFNAGAGDNGFKIEVSDHYVKLNNVSELPEEVSENATGLVLGNNNQVYKGILAGNGGNSIGVIQRFGWFFDGYVDIVEEIGPVYNLNNPYEITEINTYTRDPGPTNIVFKLEATDNFNPYFQSIGSAVSWQTLGTFTVPAGQKTWRTFFSPTIKLASRTSNTDFLSGIPVPSGDYGTWIRLTTVSGGGAEGLTITFNIVTR